MIDNHASDCAVHNGPALPVGPCDCGAELPPLEKIYLEDIGGDLWLRFKMGAKQAALHVPREGIISEVVRMWDAERLAAIRR